MPCSARGDPAYAISWRRGAWCCAAKEIAAARLRATMAVPSQIRPHVGGATEANDANGAAGLSIYLMNRQRGLMIQSIITAIDDRSFRWALKKPFPRMLLALGKTHAPCSFVMPARIAATDPFRQINEYVGSGPMRFVKDEWVPGAKAVFEKFPGYVPRPEPASWYAGGKRMTLDRIEWIVIADPATAAALQNGEVDPTGAPIRANGDEAWFGWPNSPQVEAVVAAWFDAKSFDEEKTIARRLNKAALDHVIYAPLGFFLQHQAWRKNVTGIGKGPLPSFWGSARLSSRKEASSPKPSNTTSTWLPTCCDLLG
jgi:hypothetical protein